LITKTQSSWNRFCQCWALWGRG